MGSREQFEAWWKSYGKTNSFRRKDGSDSPYVSASMQGRWEIWQAATASTHEQVAALAAENAGLKSKAAELVHEASEVYSAYNSTITEPDGDFMDMQTLQEMQCVKTPATDAFLDEVRAQGVTEYATKRGFSFQHGSIHAHFGNGDVMVGSVTFENGDAGINFAPVREKTGGIGTHYDWTKGKTAEQVDSVFVIASSNAEGLEVIRDKLSEAIAQLRQDANNGSPSMLSEDDCQSFVRSFTKGAAQ